MSDVKPIHAREGDTIDVYWRCDDGVHVVRVTCPPKAVRDAREAMIRLDAERSVPIASYVEPKLCQCGHYRVAHFDSGTGRCAATGCQCMCYMLADAVDG